MMLLDSSCLHSEGRRESLIKANFVAVKPGDEILLKGIHSGSKTRYVDTSNISSIFLFGL